MDGENWVKERANCTVAKVFELLRLQVGHDVEARNSLEPSRPSFSMVSNGESFTVLDERDAPHRAVIFSRKETAILARDGKDVVMFHASPTLSDDGDCRLNVDGKEREVWQV